MSTVPAPGHGTRRWPGRVGMALEIIAGTWVFLVLGLVWWANLPQLVGWQPRVVLSGSMSPSLVPGDVVLVGQVADPRMLVPGRLVVVRDPERASGSYVHRVMRREPDGSLVTKGDANLTVDHPPVKADRILGEVRLVVPSAGLPGLWLRQRRLLPLLGGCAVTWTALLITIRSVGLGRRE